MINDIIPILIGSSRVDAYLHFTKHVLDRADRFGGRQLHEQLQERTCLWFQAAEFWCCELLLRLCDDVLVLGCALVSAFSSKLLFYYYYIIIYYIIILLFFIAANDALWTLLNFHL